jgi:hypothetical protein
MPVGGTGIGIAGVLSMAAACGGKFSASGS